MIRFSMNWILNYDLLLFGPTIALFKNLRHCLHLCFVLKSWPMFAFKRKSVPETETFLLARIVSKQLFWYSADRFLEAKAACLKLKKAKLILLFALKLFCAFGILNPVALLSQSMHIYLCCIS